MKIRLSVTALAVASAVPAFAHTAGGHHETVLAPTVVTASRQVQRVDEVMASIDVITREEIERASGRTLIELLATRPGVQVTSNGGAGSNTSVFIRGANSQHTVLLIDGMRIGSATSGTPTFETIPLALIERIEILRGPASGLYGADAIGGVIQVFTRRDVTGFVPRVHVGAGSYDSYTVSGGFSGSADRLRYSLDAGHDRTRGFDAQPSESRGTTGDRDGWRNDFFNGSVSFSIRDTDEIGLRHYQTSGRNRYDSTWPTPFFNHFLDKRSRNTGLYLRNEVSNNWQSTLNLGWSQDYLFAKDSAAPGTRRVTNQRQVSWQHDFRLAEGNLMLAAERLDQKLDTNVAYAITSRSVNSLLVGWGGQFGRHDLQVNARRDRNSQFGSHNTGSVAYGFQLSNELRLLTSVGTGFAAPTFNQLYHPLQSGGQGNPNLRPEKSLNRQIGLQWNSGYSNVELVYFDNQVRNLIVGWAPMPQNLNRASLKGVEISSRTRLGAFDLAMGFDWLDARDDSNGINQGNYLPRRAKHAGFVSIDTAINRWRIGAEVVGQGKRFDRINNVAKMPGYVLLNLRADYQFATDWNLELRANNVLDKKYVVTRVWDTPADNVYATPRANFFIGLRYAPR